MIVHLVDGTYELFRQHFGAPAEARASSPVAGVKGVLDSLLGLLAEGATHVGVATDHVIESFRNELWPAYKSSVGMDQAVLSQFGILEEALDAMGLHVWPMVEVEADDALASAAAIAADDPSVQQVQIMTPDKDLGQCVDGTRVVQFNRRKRELIDEAAIVAKYGIGPSSIPDWLALVGDSADGYPGLPGWGAKSTSAVLARYGHIDAIPDKAADWSISLPGAGRLAAALASSRETAALFLNLATLRVDRTLLDDVDMLRWRGPSEAFSDVASLLGAPRLAERAGKIAAGRR